ncbi:MAG TPA: WecB/TagA/CpsF family glycosyltransferase [Steroidobacter sp.]|jgi:N-acetylglucosaminyldiphosphoundecaprenol N-acetyl-beta-D-mannosaminyltransferase|nr:WecB/TagA/CpsF family glycosyltransferase [Steroidobacteraceae bacterium]HLS80649.1 WecB/TagA/CpsF family glycosyltransferase [Steroidobacter sp.]
MSASVAINRPDPTHPGVERLRLVNDCPCVVLRDEAQAVALLNELIVSRQGGYSVAINAEKILYYGSRADVRELIDHSTLPYADGVGAVWGLKWMHGCKAARKINMPVACIDGAAQHGWRLFVTGAREEVNRDAVEAMRRRHPHIRIVGRMNGYEPESRRIQAIKSARPDLVMVALGSPAQERFAAKLLTRAPGLFVVGCGGALDILAGRAVRAPQFMVDNGMEWLYRLYREPARWRRQIVLPRYLWRLGVAVCGARLAGRGFGRSDARGRSST